VIVLVTGSTGFVGRWLIRELEAAGHEAIGTPPSHQLDLTDRHAAARLVSRTNPDAIAHLAAVSYAPDARARPDRAFRINVAGTQGMIEAIRASDRSIRLLVAGSSEVYGRPDPADLPLVESAPLRTDQPYGLSKLAQEAVGVEAAARFELPVIVTRAFNHTGPGQRPDFVAPALARRVLRAREIGAHEIPVGNIDVRRDIGDVRDVVRAYRLLLEMPLEQATPVASVVNVATGRAVSIREVLEMLCRLAGVEAVATVDPSLVRSDDPPEIVGDASALRALTGWRPQFDLEQTLSDLLESIERV
jgi:GDP-4-dehydro-6-deoxy-D-mannose reductase